MARTCASRRTNTTESRTSRRSALFAQVRPGERSRSMLALSRPSGIWPGVCDRVRSSHTTSRPLRLRSPQTSPQSTTSRTHLSRTSCPSISHACRREGSARSGAPSNAGSQRARLASRPWRLRLPVCSRTQATSRYLGRPPVSVRARTTLELSSDCPMMRASAFMRGTWIAIRVGRISSTRYRSCVASFRAQGSSSPPLPMSRPPGAPRAFVASRRRSIFVR